jgi:hypothetical protein
MYELLLPMIIAKVQQDKLDKGHILFQSPFSATVAMTYNVTPT